MNYSREKEIALMTSFIVHNDLLGGSLFQVFDKAYDIATECVDLHMPKDNHFWANNDYEEWVTNYVNEIIFKIKHES